MRALMSIPTLCQACYKHYRSTVVKACPFCRDVRFPEQVLCDLVREGQSEKQPFRCAAFRPALSVVRHEEIEARPVEEGSEDTVSMSPKDKWFRAYAVQQLSLNPDLIAFTIRYHVVLSTRQRVNVFSSEHREPMADLVRQAAVPFEQTTAHVIWLASDHLHLYLDATPDYALDEIVHAIREFLEHEMANLFPALQHSNQPVWERAYFAEGIG
jgi:REP element-mobilizing transposase RayT